MAGSMHGPYTHKDYHDLNPHTAMLLRYKFGHNRQKKHSYVSTGVHLQSNKFMSYKYLSNNE